MAVADVSTSPESDVGSGKRSRLRRAKKDSGTPAPAPSGRAATIDEEENAGKKWYQRQYHVGRSVPLDVLLTFTQQLGSFVEAGIPMVEGLDIALEETVDPTMRTTIIDIRGSVERGASFADAVARHNRVFPAFYRAMLQIGRAHV